MIQEIVVGYLILGYIVAMIEEGKYGFGCIGISWERFVFMWFLGIPLFIIVGLCRGINYLIKKWKK